MIAPFFRERRLEYAASRYESDCEEGGCVDAGPVDEEGRCVDEEGRCDGPCVDNEGPCVDEEVC